MQLTNNIYKTAGYNCTNGGLSSRMDRVEVYFKIERDNELDAVGYTVKEAKELATNGTFPINSIIVVEDQCVGRLRLRAIPVEHLITGKWVMFGGNFVYTSDSRGFEHPIKIHDRVEP